MDASSVVSIVIVAVCSPIVLYLMFPGRSAAPVAPPGPFAEIPLRPLICAQPDAPRDFGYKTAWLAIRTDDSDAVVRALDLAPVDDVNWETGIEGAYAGGTFVSPAIDGFVLVVSSGGLSAFDSIDSWLRCVEDLSRSFPEVLSFATHRVMECHAWIRARNGTIERAYAYSGESGEVLVDVGDPTETEKALGYDFSEATLFGADESGPSHGGETRLPNEEDVIQIAARWSIDPSRLSERGLGPSAGWFSDQSFAD